MKKPIAWIDFDRAKQLFLRVVEAFESLVADRARQHQQRVVRIGDKQAVDDRHSLGHEINAVGLNQHGAEASQRDIIIGRDFDGATRDHLGGGEFLVGKKHVDQLLAQSAPRWIRFPLRARKGHAAASIAAAAHHARNRQRQRFVHSLARSTSAQSSFGLRKVSLHRVKPSHARLGAAANRSVKTECCGP